MRPGANRFLGSRAGGQELAPPVVTTGTAAVFEAGWGIPAAIDIATPETAELSAKRKNSENWSPESSSAKSPMPMAPCQTPRSADES